MVMLSAVGFSFNGLIVRYIDAATPLQATFYRSLGMSLGLFCFYLIVYRGTAVRHVRDIGRTGVLGAALLAVSAMAMVFAMYNTTVANVVYVSCAIPFFSAALAWMMLGERVPLRMVAFMLVAFSGVSLMVGGGISAGAAFGNFMALFSTFTYASFVIVIRRMQNVDMTPMVAIAGVWICVTVPFLAGGDLAVSGYDFALCFFWGAVIAAAGHSLFVIAARNLAAAEVTFLMLLEFVLAPVWVWWLVDEVPVWTTMVGGALVMSSLVGWLLVGNRGRAT